MKQKIQFIFFFLLFSLFINGCNSTNTKRNNLIKENIGNMIFVKGGSFMMGDVGTDLVRESGEVQHLPWSRYLDDNDVHSVNLSSFWMSKYETTYGNYDLYSEITQQEKLKKKFIKYPEYRGPSHPAGASWYQANEYCLWLAKESGLPFALPTEAQWEYAARNRGKAIGFATDDGTIKRGINYTPDVEELRGVVGRYPPSPLGFYDLSGNANEWVSDWYDKDYYKRSPENNPQGPKSGTKKGVRIGDHVTTLYARGDRDPNLKSMGHGFRCVVNAETLNK